MPDGSSLPLDTPEWYSWLAQSRSFDVEHSAFRFLVYREKRKRGDLYWFARVYDMGRKAAVYLGKSVSGADLQAAAATLERKIKEQEPKTGRQAAEPPGPSIAQLKERLMESNPRMLRSIITEQLSHSPSEEQRAALQGLLALIDALWMRNDPEDG